MNNDPIIYKQVSTAWLDDDDSNPALVKSSPDLIGRVQGKRFDMESVRSETARLVSVCVPFDGATIGTAMIDVFESTGDGADGGVAIRVTIRNDASAYQPHAVLIADGVDLHIAGDTESTAVLAALHQATTQGLSKLQHRAQSRTPTPQPPQWLQTVMAMRPSSMGSMTKFLPKRRAAPGKH
jgi:hypothetical protein